MGPATPRPLPTPPSAPRAALLTAGAAAAAGVSTTALALGLGDGVGATVVPGLPDPGPLTGWGLPLAQVVAQLAAALVVGNLIAVVFWRPPAGEPGPVARLHRRVAHRSAVVWTLASILLWLFTLSDVRGVPVGDLLTADALIEVGLRTSAGQAGLAVVTAALATTLLGRRWPVAALITGLLGVLPPAFIGPAVATADHRPAVAAAVLQVFVVTLRTGACAALLIRVVRAPDSVAAAVGYGRLALCCLVVAAAATVLSAYLVLGPSDTGLDSTYGRLVAAQLVALGVLGGIGRWHRTQTVPALGRGRPGPFRRFAVLELLVLAALVGLAAALARTPSPLETGADVHHESPGQQMLGYDLPPAVSFWQLAADWRPDVLFLSCCAVAAVGYLRVEARLHRAGGGWPARRTAGWLAGVAVVAVATSSGVGRYAPVFFSVTAIQHVLLAVVAPLLLAAGAPVTLALRALPRESDGPRRRLCSALCSGAARLLTSPAAVVVLWGAGLAGTYCTGLFELTRWSYAADLAVQAYLLGTGWLLFWWLTGPDPRPAGRRGDVGRIAVALSAGACAAVVGLVVAYAPWVVGADWYLGLLRVLRLPWPWGSPDARSDQAVGGTLLWAVPGVVFLGVAVDRTAARLIGRRGRDSKKHDRSGAPTR